MQLSEKEREKQNILFLTVKTFCHKIVQGTADVLKGSFQFSLSVISHRDRKDCITQ